MKTLFDMDEFSVLKLRARILAMSAYLYTSTEKEGVSEDKKEFAFKMIDLISDSLVMVDDLIKKDAKSMSKYFDYKNKVLVLEKEIERLETENKHLKDNLC
jgi:hypothetical protein